MSNKKTDGDRQENQADADERNLAATRELDAALPPEERIKLWWEKNRGMLVFGAALILLVAIAYQGLRLYRQSYEAKVQDAWTAIESMEDRKSFAEAHEGHPLAGLAYLQLAEDAYLNADYPTAENYFRKAEEALAEPVFKGKARIGFAVSAAREGDRETAIQALESLATDPEGLHSIRSEAAYHRAILALEEEDSDVLDQYFDLLTTLRYSQGWISRLQEIRSQENL